MTPDEFIKSLRDIVGAGYVLAGDDVRTKYDDDRTGAYKGCSLAVVRPANVAEVAAVVRLAHNARIPIVPMGGNTGLAGGGFTGKQQSQIILSLERLNKVRTINPDSRTAVVEAGVILENLHTAVDCHDLVFPLLFGARGSCMIGGNLSTNAGGSNVLRYGNMRALCLGLEVVTANGDILDLMSELHKDNTGYDLKDLFIGAEGTLGIITAAVLKLFPKPKAYATAMVSVPSIDSALQVLNFLQAATGGAVEAFEYMPRKYFELLAKLHPKMRPPFSPPAEVGILVEIGATASRDAVAANDGSLPVVTQLENTLATLLETGDVLDAVVAKSETRRQDMWAQREAAFEVAFANAPPINLDVSVPLDKVRRFLDMMAQRLPDVVSGADSLAIAHLGDGNLHYTVWANLAHDAPVSEKISAKIYEVVEDTVQELGGSFSAEHGIGLAKKGSMARRKDPVALVVMRQIKAALDPDNIMNPGKVLPD